MEEEAETDRISFLPREIIIPILSRIELQDAIRTSALARSWRRLWTLLPSLRLGVSQDLFGDDNSDFPVPSTWIERVHRLVSFLRGPLLVFSLVHNFESYQSALIQNILDLLLQKGLLQELLLCCFCDPDNRVVLHLPSFQSVKTLELWGCHIILPSGFHGFNCLNSLILHGVEISNDDLHFLIHASNNLTTLKLSLGDSKHPLSLNISLPLLRYLEFYIFESFEKVSVISAPSLEKACICITSRNFAAYTSQKLARVTLGLLTSVAMVSSLHLGPDVFKSQSLVALPFNFTFIGLRCIKCSLDINAMDKRMHDVFIWLIRSAPFLEELDLWVTITRQTNRDALLIKELLLKEQDGISCLNQTLTSITIDTNIFNDPINLVPFITLVKFFLLNAKVLKLLKILHLNPFEPSMIVELQEAKMTSSHAKLVFFNRNAK
ncbi:hypothetical protein LUZ63_016347 [Rhynchospora breviuscula]|uniref:F-box domain-containing protein n=1 Tax=Rhynchospora breviuscula TaxID=2022672 RepID=A0A9P9ZBK2_9POAL|nr:hypothetical protein LUZ63_016347 [Rhynchospora breviuscula]